MVSHRVLAINNGGDEPMRELSKSSCPPPPTGHPSPTHPPPMAMAVLSTPLSALVSFVPHENSVPSLAPPHKHKLTPSSSHPWAWAIDPITLIHLVQTLPTEIRPLKNSKSQRHIIPHNQTILHLSP